MKLLAISDLHLSAAVNRHALEGLRDHSEDWVILAGDVAEKIEHLRLAFSHFTRRFARVIWLPGNHELWSVPEDDGEPPLRGETRYRALVELARSFGVVTPEDPYPLWTGPGGPCVVAPLFLLYDYSFRPADVPRDEVVSWAAAMRNVCADEMMLDPAPFPSREAWCVDRLARTEARLAALDPDLPTVLANHFPLRRDVIHIPRAPRFTPWCGTTATEEWHRRFRAKVVVGGHLHVRRTDMRDGTRFEEVSLGHPRQWDQRRGMEHYLREILPGPSLSAQALHLHGLGRHRHLRRLGVAQGQRHQMAGAGAQPAEQPMGRLAGQPAIAETDGRRLQGEGEGIQRLGQPLADGLHIGLLQRPERQEGFVELVGRHRLQLGAFGRGEEAAGHLQAGRCAVQPFHVDAHVVLLGQYRRRQPAGMRQIETQAGARRRARSPRACRARPPGTATPAERRRPRPRAGRGPGHGRPDRTAGRARNGSAWRGHARPRPAWPPGAATGRHPRRPPPATTAPPRPRPCRSPCPATPDLSPAAPPLQREKRRPRPTLPG
ncbi:MAG: metallophosphoesterase [Magnetospirillum sp.]|nr:metallophosphoesterase [Magnetospirillum sp.]